MTSQGMLVGGHASIPMPSFIDRSMSTPVNEAMAPGALMRAPRQSHQREH
eukprot:CAMPEP_0184502788 /NCGR_PEP_ID=MMETSP0113_2-20130426/51251_1 /TAXON_ID=91329 /ORGANISM="Norrisiella sphaerica, Strain BC52" /LENGTH=49 /DNA_ID= /DNA_START= /DNA_END= /DNA_ORIENTATION=